MWLITDDEPFSQYVTLKEMMSNNSVLYYLIIIMINILY